MSVATFDTDSLLADLRTLRPQVRRLQRIDTEKINSCLQHLADLTEASIPELVAAH